MVTDLVDKRRFNACCEGRFAGRGEGLTRSGACSLVGQIRLINKRQLGISTFQCCGPLAFSRNSSRGGRAFQPSRATLAHDSPVKYSGHDSLASSALCWARRALLAASRLWLMTRHIAPALQNSRVEVMSSQSYHGRCQEPWGYLGDVRAGTPPTAHGRAPVSKMPAQKGPKARGNPERRAGARAAGRGRCVEQGGIRDGDEAREEAGG